MDEARSLLFSINVKTFTTQAKESLQSLISDFGRLRSEVESSGLSVEVNTEQAEESIRNLSERVGSLGEDAGDISIDADTSEADENIRNLTDNLGSLGENVGDIEVNADTSQADENLRGLTEDLTNLGRDPPDIEVYVDTSEAGHNLRDLTKVLGDLESDAGGIGDSFSSSLKSGVGRAFTYVEDKATEFKDNVVTRMKGAADSIISGAQSIGHGFAHPIETIKGGLGGAIDSAKSKFINFVRGAKDAADAADEVGDSSDGAKPDVEELGDAANKTGDRFSKLGDVLKGAGVAIGAMAATAAAGAVALGTHVVEAYADFEQLSGGIKTLFGTEASSLQEYATSVGKTVTEVEGEYNSLLAAQDTVFKDAANAYKTAGLSANEYMELATTMSSSMIKSLGGDTKAAADAVNGAITDMSDNANKFGTDMESLQNAYRGFSMQNYTMLDNLKLGYGGTQEEMQRLLDDAGKLAGTKFEISSYADITEAIHVLQTEMGIAGTTAREAAGTISGSMASTKSAISNLIAGLGNADADIGMLVDNVVESFGKRLNNRLCKCQ